MPKIIHFEIEPIQNCSLNNLSQNIQRSYQTSDRQTEIIKQLRFHHLSEEESELIQQLCLDYADRFDLECDHISFTNEIKHKEV